MNRGVLFFLTWIPFWLLYAREALPIIYMSLHCIPTDSNKGTTPLNIISGLPSRATSRPAPLLQTLAEMDSKNIVLALFGGPFGSVASWEEAGGNRFIAGVEFPLSGRGDLSGTIEFWPHLDILRTKIVDPGIGFFGGIAAEHGGLWPKISEITSQSGRLIVSAGNVSRPLPLG